MATSYFFEQEKFKPIIVSYLNSNCDFNSMPIALKKPMRVCIQDNIPFVWISDGYHFLEGLFTKDAINEYRKNYGHIKFSSLRDKILFVSKWSIQIKQIDSRKCYTSYQNLTFQFIIEHFKPIVHDRPNPRQVSTSESLFKDQEIQALLRHKRHEVIQQELGKHIHYRLQDFSMPSFKDVFSSQYDLKQLPIEDDMEMGDEFSNDQDQQVIQQIMSYNQDIVTEVSTQITMTQVIRCQNAQLSKQLLLNDHSDFSSFEETYNKTDDTDYDNGIYYDIKRMLIQERGEDEYDFLYKNKIKALLDKIDDDFTRQELSMNLEYYNKERSRTAFKKEVQKRIEQKQKKKVTKVVKYTLGYSAMQIKEKILRFMTTFNPVNNEKEQIVETRPRSYSQENLRKEQSEIETKTVSHGYALSQYVYQQSVFNDETESERDEEDEEILQSKQRLKQCITQVEPTISLYKRYLQWFQENEVTTRANYENIQEALQMQREHEEKEKQQMTQMSFEVETQEDRAMDSEEKIMDLDYLMEQQQEINGKKSLKKTFQHEGFQRNKSKQRRIQSSDESEESEEADDAEEEVIVQNRSQRRILHDEVISQKRMKPLQEMQIMMKKQLNERDDDVKEVDKDIVKACDELKYFAQLGGPSKRQRTR